jgi:hypothetical protein
MQGSLLCICPETELWPSIHIHGYPEYGIEDAKRIFMFHCSEGHSNLCNLAEEIDCQELGPVAKSGLGRLSVDERVIRLRRL